jgi:hypothetical protein
MNGRSRASVKVYSIVAGIAPVRRISSPTFSWIQKSLSEIGVRFDRTT